MLQLGIINYNFSVVWKFQQELDNKPSKDSKKKCWKTCWTITCWIYLWSNQRRWWHLWLPAKNCCPCLPQGTPFPMHPQKQWQNAGLASQTIWGLYIQPLSTSTAATHGWFPCGNTPQGWSWACSKSQNHTCTYALVVESLCRPKMGPGVGCYRTHTIWWTNILVSWHGGYKKAWWITL